MKKTKEFLICFFKSFCASEIAAFVFILVISVIQLIFSLLNGNISFADVFFNILKLLLNLCIIGIPLSMYLALFASKIKQKRQFWMVIISFFLFWILTITIIIAKSELLFSGFYVSNVLQMSVWAMLAYSFIALPLILMLVFFIERSKKKIKK